MLQGHSLLLEVLFSIRINWRTELQRQSVYHHPPLPHSSSQKQQFHCISRTVGRTFFRRQPTSPCLRLIQMNLLRLIYWQIGPPCVKLCLHVCVHVSLDFGWLFLSRIKFSPVWFLQNLEGVRRDFLNTCKQFSNLY